MESGICSWKFGLRSWSEGLPYREVMEWKGGGLVVVDAGSGERLKKPRPGCTTARVISIEVTRNSGAATSPVLHAVPPSCFPSQAVVVPCSLKQGSSPAPVHPNPSPIAQQVKGPRCLLDMCTTSCFPPVTGASSSRTSQMRTGSQSNRIITRAKAAPHPRTSRH